MLEDTNQTVEEINPEDGDLFTFTDWPNEPKVTDLKQDYEDARSAHDSHTKDVERWLDNLNITGGAVRPKITGRSEHVPKLIRKQAEWRYASLSEPFLSTEDLYDVTPVTYEDKTAAIQNGLVLNNQFNTKIQKTKFIDELVRACVDEGTVITRIGWRYEDEEIMVPDMQPQTITDPALADHITKAIQSVSQDPSILDQIPDDIKEIMQLSMEVGVPTELVQVGLKPEINIVRNHPTLEVCDYNNIIVDPSCRGDLQNASFVIYSFESNLATLEKDGKYSNLDKIQIETNSILGEPDHSVQDGSSFNFTDKPRKKFVVYEYWGLWDIEGNGTVEAIVAAWVGNTMIRMEKTPFPDKEVPFVSIQYLPVRKSIYGQPDGELLEENQKIIGAVTRGMVDIMARAANGQEATRKDALDVTNQRKKDRGEDYQFNPQVDPKQAFHMHTYPEIPSSAPLMLELQTNDAESMSGVKPFVTTTNTGSGLGNNPGREKTSLDAVSKRELGILRRLGEGVEQIGRKIISMNSALLSEEEVVRITNEEFVTVKRDDLAGNIDLSLNISTAEADNDKAAELSFMLQTIGPNADPEERRMLQAEIARLRKMPTLAKKLDNYEPPQPDPLVVMHQQLEIKKLEAEIAKIESETAENYSSAGLDQAKTRTEGSNADLTDLDFVEEEGGVNHIRDLEKSSAQAEANKDLKRVEHLYNMREKAADAVIERENPKPKTG